MKTSFSYLRAQGYRPASLERLCGSFKKDVGSPIKSSRYITSIISRSSIHALLGENGAVKTIMSQERSSLKPIKGANRSLRRRLTLKGELALAFLPTAIILIVFALVEVLTNQRLLFASLAASAFLIYLDPQHGTNSIRSLIISQMMAATIGLVTYSVFGAGYLSGGSAMVATIVLMIVLDVVHPPAVATSLSFALRAGNENNLVLFGLALAITTTLVVLERVMLWLLAYFSHQNQR